MACGNTERTPFIQLPLTKTIAFSYAFKGKQ